MDAASANHEAVTAPARAGEVAEARSPRRRLLGLPLAVAALVLALLTPQPLPPPPDVRPATFPISAIGGEASVDINQLDAQALAEALPGVGPRYAQRMVVHRKLFGPIRRPQTLIDLGLPRELVESLGPRLRFAP